MTDPTRNLRPYALCTTALLVLVAFAPALPASAGGVAIHPDFRSKTAQHGETVVFEYDVENHAGRNATYHLDHSPAPGDWSADLDPETLHLGPNENATVDFVVHVGSADPNRTNASRHQFDIVVQDNETGASDEAVAEVVIEEDDGDDPILRLAPEHQEQAVLPGGTAHYLLHLGYDGDEPAEIRLNHTRANGGWRATLHPDVLHLDPGENATVRLSVEAPVIPLYPEARIGVFAYLADDPSVGDDATTRTYLGV